MWGIASGSYAYDAHNRRVKQTINGETIYSVYSLDGTLRPLPWPSAPSIDPPDRLKAQKRENVTTGEATDYVRLGSSGPVVVRVGFVGGSITSRDYMLQDHLGSSSARVDSSGTVTWRESYTPFGETLNNPAGNADNPGFTGHIRDTATGLTYAQARYCDPAIGRFLSNDPVGFAEGGPGYFNRYSYTLNDPVNLVDPTGMAAHPPYQDPLFVEQMVDQGVMTRQEADTFHDQQTLGGQIVVAWGLLAVPDPTDIAIAAAGVRLLKVYRDTVRNVRPRSGPGSRRDGVFRDLPNNTGRSNREYADEVFDEIVGDLPVESAGRGGRTASIGNGRQVTVRADSQGGATISVHRTRTETGSRIPRRETQEIKIRVREPED